MSVLQLFGVEFAVDFEGAKEAAEVALGDVGVADDGFAAGGRDAEFKKPGSDELPSCDGYVDEFISRICQGEVAFNLRR